jgi:RNA polymerase sigma-54 factor
MRISQQVRIGQHVTMTPQLVQSIRLLQLSAQELEAEVMQTLERNVMLEAVGDPDAVASEAAPAEPAEPEPGNDTPASEADGDWSDVSAARHFADDDEDDGTDQVAAPNGVSLQARAMVQLGLIVDDARQGRIAFAILESIDDNGYLEKSLDAVAAGLDVVPAASHLEMEAALAKVQQLDPPGFGARDLSECLALQLMMLPARTPARSLALAMVRDALDLIAARDLDGLAERFEVSAEAVDEALDLVRGLDPHPGRRGAETADYVVPDIVLRAGGRGQPIVEINGAAAPRVRINKIYERMLSGCGANAESLRTQLQEARWLVRGLEMRHQTLVRAARAIFARQAQFLAKGDEGLVPLTLQEVADAIGMHESTISRITANKYIRTPRGVLPLRHFFCSTVTARAGVEASGAAVRAVVKRLIEAESGAAPLCDGTIAALLARQGIGVARRTVAKYREALNIAPAKQRRLAATQAALRKAS